MREHGTREVVIVLWYVYLEILKIHSTGDNFEVVLDEV